jgi:hypothetical protein
MRDAGRKSRGILVNRSSVIETIRTLNRNATRSMIAKTAVMAPVCTVTATCYQFPWSHATHVQLTSRDTVDQVIGVGKPSPLLTLHNTCQWERVCCEHPTHEVPSHGNCNQDVRDGRERQPEDNDHLDLDFFDEFGDYRASNGRSDARHCSKVSVMLHEKT